jgi:glycosyltransferase involved in cell wall biosynthesis
MQGRKGFMRVAILHTRFLLYWRARIRTLDRALRTRGDTLVVVEVAGRDSTYSFARRRDGPAAEIEWIRLCKGADQKEIGSRRTSRELWRALDRFRPDVAIASAIAFPTGAAAVRWCRHRGRGVVIMDDARWEDVPRSRLVNSVKRRIYRNVDAALIPAPSHAPSYVQWGVPQERIFYSTNVVDNEWYAETSAAARERAEAIRERLGLRERFFLGIGRQVPKKNWDTLVSAYAEYRGNAGAEPWSLVLVGNGPERSFLQSLADDRGIKGVRFMPFCGSEEACAYYALADALVLPSFHGETWGLVVNEAMACRLPVLVSEQCGCAESLVQESENGWTFPPGNTKHLASLLQRMAGLSDDEREKMGARSREIIAEWPLERFAEGALGAIDACKDVSRGFRSLADRLLLALWKGRYRPT